ncbi:hypothetical protein BCV70DRAFT_182835 [Testicularia cyperi]|uniref:Zn(2)-C6 fungal-type domain-containing protein n=1 Tax=Testicularia cyperi TaxID=1882483 RepID=A0A317XZA4_9BASI|nr:hypothetical protein BCV70DRAFT_182835 [Testicularia cyperi]
MSSQRARDLVNFAHAADLSTHSQHQGVASHIDTSIYASPRASTSASASTPASASNSPGKGSQTVLVASRKQNSACDACRSRKVRCNRDPGEEKCNHCRAKNIDCTTLYVQWATSSAKRPTKRARTSIATPEEKIEVPKPPEVIDAAVQARDRLLNYLFQRDSDYTSPAESIYIFSSVPFSSPTMGVGYKARNVLPSSYYGAPKPAATTNAELALLNRQRRQEFVNDLVETYFSVVHARMPLLNPQTFKKLYYSRSTELGGAPSDVLLAIIIAWGAKFSENPLIASDRSESAAELQKAYNQAQAALSKGETEKANAITGIKGGIDQAILTVPEELRNQGRNRLADDLLWRAQEVMDRLKVSRIATLENIQACLLMEPLLNHVSVLFNGNLNICGMPTHSKHRSPLFYSNGHWYVVAVKHLLDLGINQKERVMAIKDSGVRGEMMFAWWFACMADAGSSMFFRRRCFITKQDYNSTPPSGRVDNKDEANNPLSNPDSYMAFYGSIHDLVIIERKIARLNWDPRSPIEGFRIEELENLVDLIKKWRDAHLEKVGVPLPHWPPHWDYIAAVNACSSDINYHTAWILLWQSLNEFGIYGTDRSDATSPIHQDRLKRKDELASAPLSHEVPEPGRVELLLTTIQDEALNSALRIAGLTEILRSNHYLRLDPCVSLASLETATRLLIKFQRSEVDIMIAGFRQYGLSYEDCFEKADIFARLSAAYMERARVDASFVPGSSLGLSLERDLTSEQNGIPGLAIAAAALSNAAASANNESQYTFDDTRDADAAKTAATSDAQDHDAVQRDEVARAQDPTLNGTDSDPGHSQSAYDDLKTHIAQVQESYHAEMMDGP